MGCNTEFVETAVEDVITEIAMGPFGSDIKTDCFVSDGVPVFNGSNLTGFRTNDCALRYVTDEKANSLGNALASRGDVVVTHRGTLGQIAYIPDDSRFGNYIISQSQFRLRCDASKILPEYLVYYFHTPLGKWKLLTNATQTGVPALSRPTSTFKKLRIELPSLDYQFRVLAIIQSLQNKIALNQRTNDYLAELLDVLFVDMLNDADASWERLSLLDIASYKNGLAMQKFRPAPGDPGLPVLKIKELGQGVCTPDSERCASTIDESVKIHDGNLVFSWSGTLLLDFWAGGDAGLNQHLFKVTSDRYPSWLYYLWTKHHMDRFIMLAKDRATTMGHIKRSALAESEVLIPPVEQLEVLTRRMQPIVDELVVNKIQSRNLADLRDVLLPKLMSGEIDVSNARLSMPPNNHLCVD